MTRSRMTVASTVVSVALAATIAHAQGEQWLNYHKSPQTPEMLGWAGGSPLAALAEQPEGVDLPEFKAEDPLFAKWSTPMVPAGYLLLAFDRSKAAGQYDRLYMDADCDASLADETALKPYLAQRVGPKQGQAVFSPVEVCFETEDGPVTYALTVAILARGDQHDLNAAAACWYEGRIEVAGKTMLCRLVDFNANGTFDDSAMQFEQIDRIRLGDGPDTIERYVGKYLQIDGALFHPTPARDGALITLTPATNVVFGKVDVPADISQLTLGGLNGVLDVDLVDGAGELPVGKYRVHKWTMERRDDGGARWQLTATGSPEGKTVEITTDNAVSLAVGAPIIAKVGDDFRIGPQHSFGQTLTGRMGEQVEVTRNGVQPEAPTLHIVNADGTYDEVFRFEYG